MKTIILLVSDPASAISPARWEYYIYIIIYVCAGGEVTNDGMLGRKKGLHVSVIRTSTTLYHDTFTATMQ